MTITAPPAARQQAPVLVVTPLDPPARTPRVKAALLLDGPHRGLVHPVDGVHAMVLRVEGCEHDTTCRYEVAPGQRGRNCQAYNFLAPKGQA